ncbi:MAG: hypothetical protein M3483_08620 [Gemmatimonadota bacterium]|nr:hypothetical protein [Gemmatimonadota bacterium]
MRPSRLSFVPLLLSGSLLSACTAADPAGPEPERPDSATYSLGSLRTTSAMASDCPPGQSCQGIVVTCPGVTADAPAFVAVANPTGPPRGVVLFTTGGSGMGWVFRARSREALLDQLLADGFRVVQLAWETNWLESSPGNDAGTARLGCRPATVVRWVYDQHFAPLGIARSSDGLCGFCISGNSGGATQSSYPLSHYGLEGILDAVIPTGGPPHAALTKACLRRPGEEAFWFADDTRNFIDRGFGYFEGSGPCFRSDAAFAPGWNQASVATGGTDYFHPNTRIHFLLGARDTPMHGPAGDYAARLRAEGTTRVTVEMVPNTGHAVGGTEEGQAAIRSAILAGS